MKRINPAFFAALSILSCHLPAFAAQSGTVITCRAGAQSSPDSRVVQLTHFADGHAEGGLASAAPGPVGIHPEQDGYRYAFRITSLSRRIYGNDCGVSDEEANEFHPWNEFTHATQDRVRTTYSLTLNAADPSKSRLKVTTQWDCRGGLSFLGRDGYWGLTQTSEEGADCSLRGL